MSRKENAFFVLLAVTVDIAVGWFWYALLYPTEVIPHIEAVLSGIVLTIFTVVALGINGIVYTQAIAED